MDERRESWWLGFTIGLLSMGHPFTALLILTLRSHFKQRRLPTHDNDN